MSHFSLCGQAPGKTWPSSRSCRCVRRRKQHKSSLHSCNVKAVRYKSESEVFMSLKYRCAIAVLAFVALLSICAVQGQTQNAPRSEVAGIPVNYDEAKVGTYTLPDPLKLTDGKPVRDAKTWQQKRRPEIVRLFEENQFGRSPGRPAGM